MIWSMEQARFAASKQMTTSIEEQTISIEVARDIVLAEEDDKNDQDWRRKP